MMVGDVFMSARFEALRKEVERLDELLAEQKRAERERLVAAIMLIHNCTLVIDRDRHGAFLRDVEKWIDRHTPPTEEEEDG